MTKKTAGPTPGPWIFSLAIPMKAEVLSADRRETIAWAYINELSENDPAEANMRLIAAAPDLLEAAKAVNDDFDTQAHGGRAKGYLEHWNKLRAAIARAEGR